MTLIQIAALVYLLFYYGVLLGLRGYLLYKRTGINPIKNMKKTGVEGFIEKVFLVCFILVSVIVLNYVFLENNYQYFLIPIKYLEINIVGYFGITLGLIGLLFGFIAQLQMGDSWRLGISKGESTKLINHGLFAYSRNPVYFGILISNLGFFLMMPNAVSLCFLALSYVAISIKIRLEEIHLSEKNGDDYRAYFNKVRRWI